MTQSTLAESPRPSGSILAQGWRRLNCSWAAGAVANGVGGSCWLNEWFDDWGGYSVRRAAFVSILGVFGLSSVAALAQDSPPASPAVGTPTVSMEAVAVNDIPIPGGPTRDVTIAIGDILTCKFYVRDWSPNGEVLRAFLIQIDANSYATGEQGVVQPVDFQQNPEKDPNAYMDTTDPDWVHKVGETISMPDTASEGYRFLSVVQDPKMAPTSPQNGKKYSCSVVKVTPSLNAKGVFTLGASPTGTQLITETNDPLQGVEFEDLTVAVQPTTRWRRMLASDPPDGAVDARRPVSAGETAGAWDKIALQFNSPTSGLAVADMVVEDGTSNPPRIKKIDSDGPYATIELDHGIRGGVWTTITHKTSHTSSKIGWFPGDVDGDGRLGSADVEGLVKALNRVETLPLYRTDIDGSGTLDAGDLTSLLDLLAGSPPRRAASSSK